MNGPFRIADHAADVCAVMDGLALETAHLIGASLGGSIACAVAAAAPHRIESLCALGAALEPAEATVLRRLGEQLRDGLLAEMFEDFIAREMLHGLAAADAAEARRQFAAPRRDPETIKAVTWNAFAEDARQYAPHVSCPAYLLTGEHDESCPPDAGARMADSLGARFELLPAIGHLPMLQDPILVAGKLSKFIRETQPT